MFSMVHCFQNYMKRPEHLRAKTPFFEVSAGDSYGERFEFRPIKFTRAMQQLLGPTFKWKMVMTTPYEYIVLFVLKNEVELETQFGYMIQPMLISLADPTVKILPAMLTKSMVRMGICPTVRCSTI